MLTDLRESKAYLLTQPAILIVFLVFLFDSFGSASHNLGVPILAEMIDGDRQAFYYGLLWSSWALGNVLTTYILPKIAFIRRELYWTNFIATVFMSLGFMAFLSTTDTTLVLIFAFLTGLADAFAMTTNATIMQQCDNRIRGRIFGVAGLLTKLGFGIGFIVAPILLKHLSLTKMVWAMHGMVITVAIIGIGLYGLYVSRRNTGAKSNESV
jgi:MFS family permease